MDKKKMFLTRQNNWFAVILKYTRLHLFHSLVLFPWFLLFQSGSKNNDGSHIPLCLPISGMKPVYRKVNNQVNGMMMNTTDWPYDRHICRMINVLYYHTLLTKLIYMLSYTIHNKLTQYRISQNVLTALRSISCNKHANQSNLKQIYSILLRETIHMFKSFTGCNYIFQSFLNISHDITWLDRVVKLSRP